MALMLCYNSAARSRVALLFLMLAILPALLCAARPAHFHYHAILTDSGGVPLTGSHTIFVSLFQGGDASIANSGANVYSESVSANLTDGLFNHSVGSGAPTSGTLTSDLFTSNEYMYLQVAVDVPGNITLPRQRLESVPFAIAATSPASMFGQFGGSGIDGTTTVIGLQSLTKSHYEFNDFTIPAGTTVTASNAHTFIAVKGTCTIHGGFSAVGKGAKGGPRRTAIDSVQAGDPGNDATDTRRSTQYLSMCVSGSGGGGEIPDGGNGGGAGGNGGVTGVGGAATPAFQQAIATMAQSGSGQTLTDNFQALLKYPGAGGGSGGAESFGAGDIVISGAGGAGGGVVYIECEELLFTGIINSTGGKGEYPGINSGSGGGGGGGVVLVRARKIVSKNGTVNVLGGAGGGDSFGTYGAAGAAGFWDIVELP
jgi:hypothetical protein